MEIKLQQYRNKYRLNTRKCEPYVQFLFHLLNIYVIPRKKVQSWERLNVTFPSR